MSIYEYELGKATDIIVKELFKLKEGETFVITADTESNQRVVDATARSAFSAGAKPMVINLASPLGTGEEADPMLPLEALTAALKEADAWVEFNNQPLLYSTPYNQAMEENDKLRYLNIVGANPDLLVRNVGRINYPVLSEFIDKVHEMTSNAKHFRFTTPAGQDLEFENDPDPDRIVTKSKGYADEPGSHMLAGQIGWVPKFESINGTLVFDGSVGPQIGLIKDPIIMEIERGTVVNIQGGAEAKKFERWLKSFDHPQMLKLAHACWGFNPGAKLTGDIVEDERVWGSTEWGLGAVGPIFSSSGKYIEAPSHTDGICMNTSAWVDGEQFLDKGEVVHEDFKELANKARG